MLNMNYVSSTITEGMNSPSRVPDVQMIKLADNHYDTTINNIVSSSDVVDLRVYLHYTKDMLVCERYICEQSEVFTILALFNDVDGFDYTRFCFATSKRHMLDIGDWTREELAEYSANNGTSLGGDR